MDLPHGKGPITNRSVRARWFSEPLGGLVSRWALAPV